MQYFFTSIPPQDSAWTVIRTLSARYYYSLFSRMLIPRILPLIQLWGDKYVTDQSHE